MEKFMIRICVYVMHFFECAGAAIEKIPPFLFRAYFIMPPSGKLLRDYIVMTNNGSLTGTCFIL